MLHRRGRWAILVLLAAVAVAGAGCTPTAVVLEAGSGSLVVPVEAQAADGSWRTLSLLVDTGASISVLTPRGLSTLGLSVPEDAPRLRLPTANGTMTVPLLWMPPLRLGRTVLREVSAVGCRRCPAGVDGLLGLNALERFEVTVEAGARTVRLVPHAGHLSAGLRDMAGWLSWRVRRQPVDGVPGVRVAVTNRSDRSIAEAHLTVACAPAAPLVFSALLPGERRVIELKTPDGQPCTARETTLTAGRWGAVVR